jgi:hypothetical protein
MRRGRGIASGSLSLASTVSLEAWIKPTAIPSGFASVLTKPESYALQFNSGKLEFTIMQSGTRSVTDPISGFFHRVTHNDSKTIEELKRKNDALQRADFADFSAAICGRFVFDGSAALPCASVSRAVAGTPVSTARRDILSGSDIGVNSRRATS